MATFWCPCPTFGCHWDLQNPSSASTKPGRCLKSLGAWVSASEQTHNYLCLGAWAPIAHPNLSRILILGVPPTRLTCEACFGRCSQNTSNPRKRARAGEQEEASLMKPQLSPWHFLLASLGVSLLSMLGFVDSIRKRLTLPMHCTASRAPNLGLQIPLGGKMLKSPATPRFLCGSSSIGTSVFLALALCCFAFRVVS